MAATTRRTTIHFDQGLHEALRLKAAHTHRSISDIVNDAVQAALAEDQEDLGAFEKRGAEPVLTHEDLLNELKAHRKL
jgi:plasmid stability protein